MRFLRFSIFKRIHHALFTLVQALRTGLYRKRFSRNTRMRKLTIWAAVVNQSTSMLVSGSSGHKIPERISKDQDH